MEKEEKAFQDYYPAGMDHCYGCGTNNDHGYHLKSHWDGETTVAYFVPKDYHSGGFPGFVYGGLIASLIDCHGVGTASAAAYRSQNRKMGTTPALRFVTASLKVDYIKPTPLGTELEIRGTVVEVKNRKVTVDVSLLVDGEVCATGHVVAVRLPDGVTFGAK